jgi:predicted ATPase
MPTNKDKDPVLRLDTLRVKGFRSLADATVKLSPLQVVIGPNGAGKSNVLSALRLLQVIARQGLRRYPEDHEVAQLFFRGFENTENIELEAEFRGEEQEEQFYYDQFGDAIQKLVPVSLHYRYRVVLTASRLESLRIVEESIEVLGDRAASPIRLSMGGEEAHLHDSPRDEAKRIYEAIDGWRLFHFHNTSSKAPLRLAGGVDDNLSLHADGSNLGPVLKSIRDYAQPAYERIVQTVGRVAPQFDDFVFDDREGARVVPLRWRERGSAHVMGAAQLSDGMLRFVALSVALLQDRRPTLLAVDEPELGLHPFALQVLNGMLHTFPSDRQLLIATQSAALLDAPMAPENVVVIEPSDAGTQLRRLSSTELREWLDEHFTLGQLWQMNVFGGRP